MKIEKLIEPNEKFEFHVDHDHANQRLDVYVSNHFPLYSRSFFSRLIGNELVTVNGKIGKPSMPVKEGDTVVIQFPPPRIASASAEQNPDVAVVYEDKHFLILYKPAGLVVHPPAHASTQPTLVDWILNHYSDIKKVGYIDRPGIIHRLDKDTSGLIIIPRTNYAHGIFGDMFRERMIEKTYYAIVQGHPDASGTIELPVGRHPVTKTKMTTQTNHSGKMREAKTNYKVVEYFDDAALLELRPLTGRTHQIRVQLAAIGHPIIGDTVYGEKSKDIKRHALHAAKLVFIFEGTPHTFVYDLPEDMKKLIKTLRTRTK